MLHFIVFQLPITGYRALEENVIATAVNKLTQLEDSYI